MEMQMGARPGLTAGPIRVGPIRVRSARGSMSGSYASPLVCDKIGALLLPTRDHLMSITPDEHPVPMPASRQSAAEYLVIS